MFKLILALLLKSRGKVSFLASVSKNARILDVGCGNNSPFKTKIQRPDIFYVGLDVGNYNQKINPIIYADEYMVVCPEDFVPKINSFKESFDAVISSHNLEHCGDQKDVLSAMLKSLKSKGRIFLSFPCEGSINFPSRRGALNFYDDPTHKNVPDFDNTLEQIRLGGFNIDFAARRYRPFTLAAAGFILNPCSAMLRCNIPFGLTWAYYGFESIIWASKIH